MTRYIVDPVTDDHFIEADLMDYKPDSLGFVKEEETRMTPEGLSLTEVGLLAMQNWETCTKADRQATYPFRKRFGNFN